MKERFLHKIAAEETILQFTKMKKAQSELNVKTGYEDSFESEMSDEDGSDISGRMVHSLCPQQRILNWRLGYHFSMILQMHLVFQDIFE